jgi:hypothetical protein
MLSTHDQYDRAFYVFKQLLRLYIQLGNFAYSFALNGHRSGSLPVAYLHRCTR